MKTLMHASKAKELAYNVYVAINLDNDERSELSQLQQIITLKIEEETAKGNFYTEICCINSNIINALEMWVKIKGYVTSFEICPETHNLKLHISWNI